MENNLDPIFKMQIFYLTGNGSHKHRKSVEKLNRSDERWNRTIDKKTCGQNSFPSLCET